MGGLYDALVGLRFVHVGKAFFPSWDRVFRVGCGLHVYTGTKVAVEAVFIRLHDTLVGVRFVYVGRAFFHSWDRVFRVCCGLHVHTGTEVAVEAVFIRLDWCGIFREEC